MKSLFESSGKKLMVLAQVLFVLGIVGSVCLAVAFSRAPRGGEMDVVVLVLVLVIGCVASYLTSLVLYGVGELMENVNIISTNFLRRSNLFPYESGGLMNTLQSIRENTASLEAKVSQRAADEQRP